MPTQLKTEDDLLLSAIEDSAEHTLNKAIDKGGNVNIVTEHGTPLHIVIGKNNLKIAQLLVKRGADINLVNRNFLTPIDFAAQLNNFEMLLYLITERQFYNKDTLNQYVKYCYDNYTNKSGLEYENNNHELIGHYASRLTGVNLIELLNKDKNSDKYVVHLYAYQTALKDNVPLEGWCEETFLSLRIHAFLEILVKAQRDIIKIHDSSQNARNKVLEHLEKEIIAEIETLRTVRDRLAICDHKGLDLEKAKLYYALAQRIAKQISNLNENEIYYLACGYIGHTIYVNFTKKNDDILIRIDNLGEGSNFHPKQTIDNKVHLAPYKLGALHKDRFTEKDVITYLSLLLVGRDKWNDPVVARETIYDELDKLKAKPDSKLYPKMEEQSANTCVAANHQVGLLLRSYEPEFYEWLINQEKQCIVNSNRAKPSLNITRDNYWEDQYLIVSDIKSSNINDYLNYQTYGVAEINLGLIPFMTNSNFDPYSKYSDLVKQVCNNIANGLYQSAMDNCSDFIKKHVKDLSKAEESLFPRLLRGHATLLWAESMNNPSGDIYKKAHDDFFFYLHKKETIGEEDETMVIDRQQGNDWLGLGVFEEVLLAMALCAGKIGTLTHRPAFHEEASNNLRMLFNSEKEIIKAFAYFKYAVANHLLNRHDEAIDTYKIAIKLFSQLDEYQRISLNGAYSMYFQFKMVAIKLNLASVFYEINDLKQAESCFEEVMKSNVSDPSAHSYSSRFNFDKPAKANYPYQKPLQDIKVHALYGLGLIQESYMKNAESLVVKKVALENAQALYIQVLNQDINHTEAQRHLEELNSIKASLEAESNLKKRKLEPDLKQNINEANIIHAQSGSNHDSLVVMPQPPSQVNVPAATHFFTNTATLAKNPQNDVFSKSIPSDINNQTAFSIERPAGP